MNSKTHDRTVNHPPPGSQRATPRVLAWSRLDPDRAEKILGWFEDLGWRRFEKTGGQDHRPDRLGALLSSQPADEASDLLIVSADLALTPDLVARLVSRLNSMPESDEARVLTVLSNASAAHNPFAQLQQSEELGSDTLEKLVSVLGSGEWFEPAAWGEHFMFLNPAAQALLANSRVTDQNALAALYQRGGRLLLSDDLFIPHPGAAVYTPDEVEPHEQRRPAAWGRLVRQLGQWLDTEFSALQHTRPAEGAVTLHVTHSWGGGVARWVDTYITHDDRDLNLQLRSEGPQSGLGAGQRLSLYLGNKDDVPVDSWWIQPPIRSTACEHPAYRDILRHIIDRFGVGRIIVSSLVGHSLDVLRTGTPTVQVLHDYYPAWPLLGVHPGPFLEKDGGDSLERALGDHALLPDFEGQDAATWKLVADRWRETVTTSGVRLVAPSRSVADLLTRLQPAWESADIEIVPHGLPPLPVEKDVVPRDREDGKLRLVIPGRVQQGKGRDLLLAALPELTRYAQVYLVGAGKEGEVFFGRSGVDIVLQYDNEELPALLAGIGPHFAALLSVVPETFSYTLSEMQALNVPVVATRVGSFEERISDGEDGWLIDPSPESLVDRVRQLSTEPGAIERVREGLAHKDHPPISAMLERYRALCPAVDPGREVRTPRATSAGRFESLSFEHGELEQRMRSLSESVGKLQDEVEERTRWAEERQRVLEEEQVERKRHVESLNRQLELRFEELEQARADFARAQSSEEEARSHLRQSLEDLEDIRLKLEQTELALEQHAAQLSNLQATHEWVLSSPSWRMTRPFRVGRRILGNFMRARAWNPVRWPLLLSQTVRTIRTVGLRGAVDRAQLSAPPRYVPEPIEVGEVEEIGSHEGPESLPFPAEPVASIVIPVHNKWAFTAACLRSLAETADRAEFEVIVVDDRSSDETPGCLAEIEGLVVVRNDENVGFIGSCNAGAKRARGKYVVMLNNDTQVLDGWLDALIGTFERFPDTGLAGARLVYPDGTLQEAGGIVFNDGSGWNYGKHDDAQKPEYLFVREVDYCSGACIMLTRELWQELGGFDTHFTPAYYEDTDLAFRIRDRGLKVRVQPRSTIVHHEGISSGTDITRGVKSYQAVNREKFLERWQEALADYPEPMQDPDDLRALRRCRDHRLKGRILVIDAYTPEPDQDSGSLRLRHLLNCMLSLGYGVTFFAENRGHSGKYTKDLQQAGIEVLYDPWIESFHTFFRERCNEFDFIIISRHYVAANFISLIQRYCPDSRFIFDTVDLHYLREFRMAELENSLPLKRAADQTRRSELSVIEAADATLVVSTVEKSVLEQDAPDARVHVISNVHEVVGSQKPWSERKDIFFVGGYQHPPNVDAACWFVNSIWPLVREELPDLTFHLIGSKANEKVRALHGNGVKFHGFVQSLDPWLDGCRLAVAPLRYGAGVKGKVNMSMSRGQPVVATPMAVEGMFVTSGEEVLVAESAEDFARAVIRLYQDELLWNRISAAAVDNVREYFSIDTARNSLKMLFRDLS